MALPLLSEEEEEEEARTGLLYNRYVCLGTLACSTAR